MRRSLSDQDVCHGEDVRKQQRLALADGHSHGHGKKKDRATPRPKVEENTSNAVLEDTQGPFVKKRRLLKRRWSDVALL